MVCIKCFGPIAPKQYRSALLFTEDSKWVPSAGKKRRKVEGLLSAMNSVVLKSQKLKNLCIVQCKCAGKNDMLALQPKENQKQRLLEGKVFGLRTLVDFTNERFNHSICLAEFFLKTNHAGALAQKHAQAAWTLTVSPWGINWTMLWQELQLEQLLVQLH